MSRPSKLTPEERQRRKLARTRAWRQTAKGKACQLASNLRYAATPRGQEVRLETIRRYNNDPEVRAGRWRGRLQTIYGLTPSKFDALLIDQRGLCALCWKPMTGPKDPCVDHDHNCCPGKKSCGKCVRGLLHMGCNVRLTPIENAHFRGMALQYLERYHGVS